MKTLSISAIKPRKKISFQLKGFLVQKGNGKIVYDEVHNRLELHTVRDVKKKSLGKKKSGVDFGMSEVLTDEEGNQYGKDLWRRLEKQNQYLLKKGKNKNKYRDAVKNCTNPEKKRKMEKFNTSKNYDRCKKRNKDSTKNEINRGFQSYFHLRKVNQMGMEDLSGMSGKQNIRD